MSWVQQFWVPCGGWRLHCGAAAPAVNMLEEALHQRVRWYEHCELKLSNYQLYLDEYDHIFCFIAFFKVIFKMINFQTFKEKLQKKKVTKMRHVIIPIQPVLPELQFMKWIFHENGYCSQSCGLWLLVSFWMCSLVFFENTDVVSTDISAFLVEILIKIQNHINSPLQRWCVDMIFDWKKNTKYI